MTPKAMASDQSSFIQRNFSMDGIRGLAVLIVFMSHTSGREQAISPYLQFHGIGHIGVYLFFVLSGFLLASNLIDESIKYGHISVRNFLIRRFLRVAPLYYLVVTLVFLFQVLTAHVYPEYLHIDNSWLSYFKHLLFLKGDGVFWTVPAEFVFYLALPYLVIWLLKSHKVTYIAVSFFALAYFLWFLLIKSGHIPVTWALKVVEVHHSSQFLDVFLCGVLAAFVQKRHAYKAFIAKNSIYASYCVLLVFALSMFITCCMVAYSFMGFHRPFYDLRWFSLGYGVLFSLVILSTLNEGVTKSLFESKLLVFLGRVGFSWYLVHFLVLQLVNMYLSSPILRFSISFLVCALVSSLLYQYVERPFIELGKKLTSLQVSPKRSESY